MLVSIYENGSTDRKRLLLADLGAALQAIGVDGLWLHSSCMSSDFADQDRMVMHSGIRNLALAPLLPYATGKSWANTLLMMNNVVSCTSDVLELIHQQQQQRVSMVMGMNWLIIKQRIRPGELGYLYSGHPDYNRTDSPYTNVARLCDL